MKPKHQRLAFVGVAIAIIAGAAGLMLNAFESSVVFFHSPTDLVEKDIPQDRRMRIGGLVEDGSVEKPGDAVVEFRVTDMTNTVPVVYRGLLPDLFREGQGVVAEGQFINGVFRADEVLAKHDETYMPPEVADALKKSGQWKDGDHLIDSDGY